MSRQQVAAKLETADLERLDRLVDQGIFANRAQAIRVAVAELVERMERRRIDDALIEGYRRRPQSPDDDLADWVSGSSRELGRA